MPREVIDGNDALIPHAADRADRFLQVIRERSADEGVEIKLTPARRGLRDPSPILRATVKAGYQNQVELEVFADPQGRALHVGWHASRVEAGGFLANQGAFGQANALSRAIGGTPDNQRRLSGALQSFELLVFRPVVDQLLQAVRAQSAGTGNGFLGA